MPSTYEGMEQDLPVIPPDSISYAAPTLSSDKTAKVLKMSWNELPNFQEENFKSLWPVFLKNCAALMKRGIPSSSTVVPWANPEVWRQTCQQAQKISPNNANAIKSFLEKNLDPWQISTNNNEPYQAMVTGYYEPFLRVSKKQGGEFQWPLFGVPKDLVTSKYKFIQGKPAKGRVVNQEFLPYFTRAEIMANPQKFPIVAWADDPIDAFFLQIQGSGRILQANGAEKGKISRLAYADTNGHTYVSIGKWLVDNQELTLSQASMQGIKGWIARNPTRTQELLNVNPAMIFFKEEPIIDVKEGPKGSFAVPLTGQRAIAVDPNWVALGTPVYLSTTLPGSTKPMHKFVFAQDTGSAIKGPGRADFFWGSGPLAGEYAGKMRQAGKSWIIWPKGHTPKLGS